MRKLIRNDLSRCTGCNGCVRVCPIDEVNVAFMEDDRWKIRIDNEKCIVCGACLTACRHGSRIYEDDTEKFIEDLENGETISVFCDPAARLNLRDWDRILAWLRKSGARNIFDVSLGADICTWAYIRWIQQNSPKTVISQPCQAIVDYVLLHNPLLLPYLSPVHSPMMSTAIYMRRYQDINGKLAAISPCIAKANEFEETGNLISYNVTFRKLEEYIARSGGSLPAETGDYDHPQTWPGSTYSYPGELKEKVEFFLGSALRVDKSEGPSVVYKALDKFVKDQPLNWPMVFDVLNCCEGCNLGTGTVHGRSAFEAAAAIENAGNGVHEERERGYFGKMLANFDDNLRLTDFTRIYHLHAPTTKKETRDSLPQP